MDKRVKQLVEMGATGAQARAALKQYNDVMQAAEQIFDGEFDNAVDDVDEDGDANMEPVSEQRAVPRLATPDDEDEQENDIDVDEDDDDDDDGGGYIDYDSDYDQKAEAGRGGSNADPYAGIFFSKDRREEVPEIEEEPEFEYIQEVDETVPLMTRGEWLRGCPEGGEQSFLFGLYHLLTEEPSECPNKCGAPPVQRRKRDFFALYANFSDYLDAVKRIARRKCTGCQVEMCMACCGTAVSNPSSDPTDRAKPPPLFHCANVQGVILGVGLFMVERLFAEQTKSGSSSLGVNQSDSRGTKKRKAETPQAADQQDSDEEMYYGKVGRGKKAKGGTGYAGNKTEDISGQLEALSIQKAKDEKIGALLAAVRTFVPSAHREPVSFHTDFYPHPTSLAQLRRRFNHVSSTLLRNDSLADMSDRNVLYFELFEWLQTISNHEQLSSMMAMPIMVAVSSKTSPVGSGGKGATSRERTTIYEGSSGPRELLEAIVIQSQAAIRGLEGLRITQADTTEMTEEQKRMTMNDNDKGKGKEKALVQTEENERLLKFCERILATAHAIDRSLRELKGEAFVERLHASLPKIPSSTDAAEYVEAGTNEEETKRLYVKWANRVRFEYCDLTVPRPPGSPDDPDERPHYKFVYNNEARQLVGADLPKRSLAIAKELAVLTTNLPVAYDSAVFLRVDETRVDIIKALIIGPEGTPYQNGCYLFDIFLGASYNQAPPSVKYMTTNGGKYRFNPNLYAEGKVCLSLLGTWSGPGWVSGKSTLLQVLISIQSMILNDEPYLNEPGWASDGGTPQSIAYSANVRRMVVNTAMLGNLKNPPEPFVDVIRTHFRLKARAISKQLDEWLAMDDKAATLSDGTGVMAHLKKVAPAATAGGSSTAFAKDVAELKTLLQQL